MLLHKSIRHIMQGISVILTLVLILLIIQEYKADRQKEELIQAYTYKNHGAVQYDVFLKPNNLYSKPSISEGNIYVTELVDFIKVTFTYDFTGERPANITGDYEIIASIEGNMNITEDYTEANQKVSNTKTIWKKDSVLVPKTEFKTDSDFFSVNKTVILNYHEYNALSKEIIELTKLNIPTRLSTCMNVKIYVKTEKGVIEENYTQSIVVPFGANSFEIQKNETGDIPGSLDESKTIQLPVNMKNVYGYVIGIIPMLLILIWTTFFTRDKNIVEYIIELNRIFKKYSSRLVAVNTLIAESCEKSIKVKTMEDMLKLADEMGRPIIYRHSENPLEIMQFYIFSDSRIYEFNLKENMNGRERKNEKKDFKNVKASQLKTQINYKSRVRPDSIEIENTDLV